jgi:hypothetical protein
LPWGCWTLPGSFASRRFPSQGRWTGWKNSVRPTQLFPNGCHVAEVEIDPETGQFALAAYTAVDDAGTVLNLPMVEGQVMGGIAQGFGQVAAEHCVYDESGQILTGSFMDYGMPRADDLPSFRLGFHETPSPATPLGAKGCGEAGTTGALPAGATGNTVPGAPAAARDRRALGCRAVTCLLVAGRRASSCPGRADGRRHPRGAIADLRRSAEGWSGAARYRP